MPTSEITYRPYFNRSRVIYFFHPRPLEIVTLIDLFQEQGFITNVAVNLAALERLSRGKAADAIIAYATGDEAREEVQMIKQMALHSRVYILTDEAPTISQVVRTVRSGALSVFVQPVQVTEVLREVQTDLLEDVRLGGPGSAATIQGFNSLTPREREVLEFVVNGGSNKEAGKVFNISPRTVEVHRAKAMQKLGARNTAELVRIALGK